MQETEQEGESLFGCIALPNSMDIMLVTPGITGSFEMCVN